MTDVKLQIRLESEKKVLWKDKADEMGLTLTDMIKKAVDDFVMTKEDKSVMTEEKISKRVMTNRGGVKKGGRESLAKLEAEGLVQKGWSGPIFKDDKMNKKVVS